MAESKVFMFPESGNSLLDPNLMMALNNNGGFGGNGNWMWIIFLFFLYPLMRNGGFFGGNGIDGSALGTGYLSNLIMNGAGRDLLMQAVQGNRDAITALSNQMSTTTGNILTAVNSLMNSVQQVGNQVGMTSMLTINAVNSGNAALGQLIAQCCCDNKLLVTQQGYENLIATLNQTNTLQNTINNNANSLLNAINNNTVKTLEGFTTVTFQNLTQQANTQRAIADGVLNLKDATTLQTNSIIAKLDLIEDARKDREINNLTALLASVTAKAEREAELAPIVKQLDGIQCKLPNTVTLPYSNAMAIPACSYYNAAFNGLFGLNPTGGSIWS